MKYLKAVGRFIFAPEFELWWSGFFLCHLANLVNYYPQSGRTAWDMAYIAVVAIFALHSTIRSILHACKGRA